MKLLQSINEASADLKRSDRTDAGSSDVVDKGARDVTFSLMRNTINSDGDLTGSDVADYLEKAQELNDEVESVPFGLETDDGQVVKVWVNAEQADEFEAEMKKLLGVEDDIEEAINNLALKFDIVDVVWPDDEDEDGPHDDKIAGFDVLDDDGEAMEVVGEYEVLKDDEPDDGDEAAEPLPPDAEEEPEGEADEEPAEGEPKSEPEGDADTEPDPEADEEPVEDEDGEDGEKKPKKKAKKAPKVDGSALDDAEVGDAAHAAWLAGSETEDGKRVWKVFKAAPTKSAK